MSDPASLAERLESIIEDLDDLAFERLRVAMADGEVERPRSDRDLTRARRAVEKAARVLRELEEYDSNGDSGR